MASSENGPAMGQRLIHFFGQRPGRGHRLTRLAGLTCGLGGLTLAGAALQTSFRLSPPLLPVELSGPLASQQATGLDLAQVTPAIAREAATPSTIDPENPDAGQVCDPSTLPEPSPSRRGPETPASLPSPPSPFLAPPLATEISSAVSPDLVGRLGSVPWPAIHPTARLARVPILMYHDVIADKEVFFDVTPAELADQFERIQAEGLTPISLDQLVQHLQTGAALPPRPIVLSFDDGYAGHYTQVYPLLKQYGYPAVFSIFPGKLDGDVVGRSTVSWAQLKTMAADPLVTIAAHSVTHPPDLRALTAAELRYEVTAAKTQLEEQLGFPIRYFTYPAGYYDDRVVEAVTAAGYEAALTMSNDREWFAGESDDLLTLGRFGQSSLTATLPQVWEGIGVPLRPADSFDFASPIRLAENIELEGVPITLISGGRPVTVHADSRYQVPEILVRTNATAAVDGGFFSLKYLDSNVMIGPVLSQSTRTFVPGNASENPKLNGRPLVLISPGEVRFIPFEADKHNLLAGLQREMPAVTDGFVASAWLVKAGKPQSAATFAGVFDFDAHRHRAFWGINRAGQPVIGVTQSRVDSVTLGQVLHQAGLRDAVMVDSGASTSLAYRDRSLVAYTPRPVPHLVALLAPEQADGVCPLVFQEDPVVLASPQETVEDAD